MLHGCWDQVCVFSAVGERYHMLNDSQALPALRSLRFFILYALSTAPAGIELTGHR